MSRNASTNIARECEIGFPSRRSTDRRRIFRPPRAARRGGAERNIRRTICCSAHSSRNDGGRRYVSSAAWNSRASSSAGEHRRQVGAAAEPAACRHRCSACSGAPPGRADCEDGRRAKCPTPRSADRHSAPAISRANSGEKVPCTVETLTPIFSNTRPRMIDMTPPPPSLARRRVSRISVRTGPAEFARRAGQILFRSFRRLRKLCPAATSNQARAFALRCSSRLSLIAENCSSGAALPPAHSTGMGHVSAHNQIMGIRSAHVRLLHEVGHARALPAQHQRVVLLEHEVGIGAFRPGGQKNEPP